MRECAKMQFDEHCKENGCAFIQVDPPLDFRCPSCATYTLIPVCPIQGAPTYFVCLKCHNWHRWTKPSDVLIKSPVMGD